jgi:hypothetical protein
LWQHLDDFDYVGIYSTITDSFNELLEINIISRVGFSGLIDAYPSLPLLVFMAIVMFACLFMRNTQEKAADGKYSVRRMAVTIILIIWSVFSLTNVSEFLYFNF